MFKKILIITLLLFLASCATNKGAEKNPKIIFSKELMEKNPEDVSFWIMFGVSKIVCNKNFYDTTFGQFSCAFKLAFKIGDSKPEEGKDKPAKPRSQFIKDLHKVDEAGFLNEYIFYNYRHYNWFLEPNLKTAAYQQWMEKNLKDHVPSELGSDVENLIPNIDRTGIKKIQLSDGFIKSIGNLRFAGIHYYDEANLGVSIRYQIASNINGWVDFYVYPNLSSEKSRKNHNGLIDEATISKSGLLYYLQKDNSKKFQILEESFDSNTGLLKGRYEIERDGALYIDEIILSAKDEYFLKVRSSFLKGQREYSDKEVDEVFESVLASIK